MPILFSAVSLEKDVLNKFASCDGNFEEILELVLAKIPNGDYKMTYLHGRYLLHYISENKHLYFCITDKLCQRSRAFLFLNEIKRRFLTITSDFSTTLGEQMYRYNEDCSTIIIRKGEIDELNAIGVKSSENILGEKLLIVNNDMTLKYTAISNIGKTPDQVTVSFISSNINIIYIITLAAIAICLFYIINPSKYAIMAVILIYFISKI